ncbi:MFS general substrate transporter [Chiua virens]|nr:MFS general substrate transporter [Chiua virens]
MPIFRVSSKAASSDSQGEKQSESPLPEHHAHAVSTKEIDTGAQLVAGLDLSTELDPAESARVRFVTVNHCCLALILSVRGRKKIDYHILPMMCTLYWIQFMDKTTLGSAAILGIDQGAHLSTSQYNWLGTIFYISYFIFEYPQNLALQRFPVGRWMSFNIFVWGIALVCQAASNDFAKLFVCRFFLGACEGSITAGFMIVSSMFYTRKEQTLRVGYWCTLDERNRQVDRCRWRLGAHTQTAQIISGFISFGSLHIHTAGFAPWQWLMIITGCITLLVAVLYWFFFPDSPTNAWFLTPSERATAVQRLKENQTGVENKHFKKEQMIEALLDPKTWLFALFSALDNIPNSLTNQRSIIISSLGFTYLDTTLLGCVDGFIEIMTIWTGVTLAARIPNGRAYVGAVYFLPSLIGVLMIEFLPWSNQIGLLFGIWLVDINTTGFVLALSWLTNVTCGPHQAGTSVQAVSRIITTNAIMLSAYCIGNAAGPFMWQAKYKPRYGCALLTCHDRHYIPDSRRNHIPWIIIGICYIICPLLLLAIRWLLGRENARRDAEPIEDDEFFIEKEMDDGTRVQVKVDKAFMDLTDRENRDYRYVL